MFLRINSSGKYRYIQILHNYREGSKLRHKIITPLGLYKKECYQMIKDNLKDWKRMKRVDTIIDEFKNDIGNVKRQGEYFLLTYCIRSRGAYRQFFQWHRQCQHHISFSQGCSLACSNMLILKYPLAYIPPCLRKIWTSYYR